ncbi:MAG: HAD-IB family hydrolase [Candidatus Liptonbacteria bacterium]|nr:HAD-IB family hydrolase [Candidatus Liptonbacteria bacterium]
MSRRRKVAIFDIDGTLFRSSLLIELVEALLEEKIFPARARRHFARAEGLWRDRRAGYEDYIHGVIRAFDAHIRGVHRNTFLGAVRRVVRVHRRRTYRYTRNLVRLLRRRGYYLLAVSHSPKYVVEAFAKRLGFHKVYGRRLVCDARGRFTGAVMDPELIEDKEKIVRRALAKEGLALSGSVGVGDTESDIPFLRLVSRPICFNPNQMLYRAARRRGWEVVVERRDVVYRIARAA